MSSTRTVEPRFDIFARSTDGHPIWIASFDNFEAAKERLEHVARRTRCDCFVYSEQKGTVEFVIPALFPENVGSKDLAHQKATKAPEVALAGAGSGAIVGGALGWLAGLGVLLIPGIGPGVGAFVAAGPIVSALAGVGLGGTVGGLAGAIVGMGIPEIEAKRYEGRVRAGGILLSVHCDSKEWTKRAKRILDQTGAHEVCSTGEARADYAESDKPLSRSATAGKTT